jgi:hypothetical protein
MRIVGWSRIGIAGCARKERFAVQRIQKVNVQ